MAPEPDQSVQQLIDARPIGTYQLGTIALIFAVILVDGYDLLVMATAVPAIADRWSIPPASFGLALAAVSIGLAAGAMCTAPLADHVGRRPIILAGLLAVGLTSVATASSRSLTELFIWRLLTGAGLGTCFSSAFALLVDLTPRRRKALFAALHGCNTSLGASLGGFVAPEVLAMYGWRGVFIVGGILPLIVCIPAAFCLPESPPLLASRKHDLQARAQLERILRRMGIATPIDRIATESDARTVATRIAAILQAPYRARTLLLWAIFIANSFTLYYLSGWLPTLLQAAGLPLPQALRASSFLWMGGIVGAVVISWLIDHRRARLGLMGALLGASVILGAMLVVPASFAVWGAMIFGLGVAVSGVQFALPGLAALLYPATILATGNGWAVSIGRLGAVSGPIVGGWLLAQALPPATILGVLAIPALFGASLVVALFAVWSSRSGEAGVALSVLARN